MKRFFVLGIIFLLLIQSAFAFSIFGREITVSPRGIAIAQQKTITAQQHQQATYAQQSPQTNEQTTLNLIDVNLVLEMVNTDETLSKMIQRFEGDKFNLVTDKRTIQLSVINGKVVQHPHDVADYTLTTTEANLDYLVAKAGMRPLTFGDINSRVDIPLRLKLKTVGVLGLFGIGVD